MIIVIWILVAVVAVWLLELAAQLFKLAVGLLLLPFRILGWMFAHPKSFLWLLALVLLAKIFAQ